MDSFSPQATVVVKLSERKKSTRALCRQFGEVYIDMGCERCRVLNKGDQGRPASDRIEWGRLVRQPRWGPPRVPTRGFSAPCFLKR